MRKRLLFDHKLLCVTISRLCQQLLEVHGAFSDTFIIGMQPKGIYLAERIKTYFQLNNGFEIPIGYLDTTFHRDDFRRRETPAQPNQTKIDFSIEDKNIVLVDDVLFTGRTVRSALDAINSYGRPKKVELLVLIDRMHSRHIPIEANYVGREVNTIRTQRISVELQEQGRKKDNIWLIDTEEWKH